MARILRFDTGPHGQPRTIDAARLWDYVLPRLDFPLPAFIAAEIHGIVTAIWKSSEREINFHDCVDALEVLEHRDILLPPARRERIISLVFEYLSKNGYLYETE